MTNIIFFKNEAVEFEIYRPDRCQLLSPGELLNVEEADNGTGPVTDIGTGPDLDSASRPGSNPICGWGVKVASAYGDGSQAQNTGPVLWFAVSQGILDESIEWKLQDGNTDIVGCRDSRAVFPHPAIPAGNSEDIQFYFLPYEGLDPGQYSLLFYGAITGKQFARARFTAG